MIVVEKAEGCKLSYFQNCSSPHAAKYLKICWMIYPALVPPDLDDDSVVRFTKIKEITYSLNSSCISSVVSSIPSSFRIGVIPDETEPAARIVPSLSSPEASEGGKGGSMGWVGIGMLPPELRRF